MKKRSFKVLSIGSSFSMDAIEYLYDIAGDMGIYDEIILGNIYIGGTALKTHAVNAAENKSAYTYYKNSVGKWENLGSKTMLYGIKDEDWDYIVLMQTSNISGKPETYSPYLQEILEYIKANLTTTETKIAWHMTWAFQSDFKSLEFKVNYNADQMVMYKAIINAVKEQIIGEKDIDIIIPCAVAVQNLRTSFIGDTFTRDGFHMSYTLGRYLVGLTWYSALSENYIDLSKLRQLPGEVHGNVLAAVVEAANNAIKTRFYITQSIISDKE